jgi:L-rhamnose isomerase
VFLSLFSTRKKLVLEMSGLTPPKAGSLAEALAEVVARAIWHSIECVECCAKTCIRNCCNDEGAGFECKCYCNCEEDVSECRKVFPNLPDECYDWDIEV